MLKGISRSLTNRRLILALNANLRTLNAITKHTGECVRDQKT